MKKKTEDERRKTEDCSLKSENCKLKILIAPLNWGIGHATRCIPIINELLKQGFTPILASDGNALLLLQKEFPNIKTYELPSYGIQYAKNASFFKIKLFFQTPKILRKIKEERVLVNELIKKENIKGLISDNRFGVWSNKIPSVYITHQTKVLSGLTTFFTTKIHQRIINKYDVCWIPDVKENPKLSGKLSNALHLKTKYHYLGVLSRFQNKLNLNSEDNKSKYDILVLLSGQEPQRTLLENKLISEFKSSEKKVLFVRGVISEHKKITNTKNSTFINYLLQNDLEKAINKSDLIISRSGYSTIMDLATLQKKAFFIPTPGQTEQEYLATHLNELQIAPFCKQNDFNLSKLSVLKNYTGFDTRFKNTSNFTFKIFATAVK